jgi:hypothetical protein
LHLPLWLQWLLCEHSLLLLLSSLALALFLLHLVPSGGLFTFLLLPHGGFLLLLLLLHLVPSGGLFTFLLLPHGGFLLLLLLLRKPPGVDGRQT